MSNSVQDKVLFKKKYLNFYVSNILRLTLKKKNQFQTVVTYPLLESVFLAWI